MLFGTALLALIGCDGLECGPTTVLVDGKCLPAESDADIDTDVDSDTDSDTDTDVDSDTDADVDPANQDQDGDGFTPAEGDCDDQAGSVYPGAYDVYGDGIDSSCDGVDGMDLDGDGYASEASGGDDCDDLDPSRTPADADGDGFSVCTDDCDDAEPAVAPGFTEACDALDNDCDGGVDLDPTGFDPCARDESFVVTGGQLDLLWVVDDSGSMAAKQQRLVDIADTLVDGLEGVDYHLGIVTTDMTTAGRKGRLVEVDGLRWLEPGLPRQDAIDWLSLAFQPGTLGSGTEEGLDAIVAAFQTFGATFNAGFERPGADLAVVVTSDEDDQSPLTASDFEAWFLGWKAAPAAISFTAHISPATSCGVDWVDFGAKYDQVAVDLGGARWSVCDANLTAEAQTLLAAVAPAVPVDTAVVLTEAPDPTTIAVVVVEPDGTVVTLAAGDFTFDLGTLTVTFTGYVPPGGSTVTVSYRVPPTP